jgi:hypothetical protein
MDFTMKTQQFSALLITGTIATIAPAAQAAGARPSPSHFYLYQGQPVPLETQTTEIAVVFKPQPKTRGTRTPLYRQLQTDLNQGGRSLTRLEVNPLGQQYALVSAPSNVRGDLNSLQTQIAAQPYVEATLPVLNRPDKAETILLNNELIIRFQPTLSESQGGDTSERSLGGILVAGGTGLPNLWRNIPADASMTGAVFDRTGKHFWTQGTSFASPAVAGVVALMKAADPQRKLTRAQMIQILQRTANRSGLSLSDDDRSLFERAVQQQKIKAGNGAEAFFFGSGLVDADAAVAEVQRLVR